MPTNRYEQAITKYFFIIGTTVQRSDKGEKSNAKEMFKNEAGKFAKIERSLALQDAEDI